MKMLLRPLIYGEKRDRRGKPMAAEIVYQHPQGRFVVAEFDFGHYKVRESFCIGQDEKQE